MALLTFFTIAAVFTVLLIALFLLLSVLVYLQRPVAPCPFTSLAFLHPYCFGGGGGERVLWHAVLALKEKFHDKVDCTIYTCDNRFSASQILERVQRCFNIRLEEDQVHFVFVKTCRLIEASSYPRFTMIGQSLGSIILALECLLRFRPQVFIDTTGFAFSYPLAKYIFNCSVACYTHYPTISLDMISRVEQRASSYNNDASLARSAFLSNIKVFYYKAFAWCYAQVGRCADTVMVNSSWTYGHIHSLWGSSTSEADSISIVYPPCDTAKLIELPLGPREPLIISVGQFRPEKNHHLQIMAFNLMLRMQPDICEGVRLVMIGGARHSEDRKRVSALMELVENLGLADRVDFITDASFETLVDYLGRGLIGLHTMRNEHFGIGVVEYMAAGLVTVAHASGGPLADIVVKQDDISTGFLAQGTPESFAETMLHILRCHNNQDHMELLRSKARHRVLEFSDANFRQAFIEKMKSLIPAT